MREYIGDERMKKALLLLIALFLVATYAHPALSAQNISMYILVKDELGNAIAGAKVMVFDNTGAKVTEGTTNSSGYVQLSIPNTTVTFIVELATSKYMLNTTDMTKVNTTEVDTITLDASTMNYATISANITGITATIKPILNNKTEFRIETNATVYAKESINITFPKSKILMPFVEARLKEIKVDTTSYTNTTEVTVSLSSSNVSVVAGYVKYYTFTYTWETYAIIAFVAVLFILLLASFVRTGKSFVGSILPKKYIRINQA